MRSAAEKAAMRISACRRVEQGTRTAVRPGERSPAENGSTSRLVVWAEPLVRRGPGVAAPESTRSDAVLETLRIDPRVSLATAALEVIRGA
jgi:hypothetical protein